MSTADGFGQIGRSLIPMYVGTARISPRWVDIPQTPCWRTAFCRRFAAAPDREMGRRYRLTTPGLSVILTAACDEGITAGVDAGRLGKKG